MTTEVFLLHFDLYLFQTWRWSVSGDVLSPGQDYELFEAELVDYTFVGTPACARRKAPPRSSDSSVARWRHEIRCRSSSPELVAFGDAQAGVPVPHTHCATYTLRHMVIQEPRLRYHPRCLSD